VQGRRNEGEKGTGEVNAKFNNLQGQVTEQNLRITGRGKKTLNNQRHLRSPPRKKKKEPKMNQDCTLTHILEDDERTRRGKKSGKKREGRIIQLYGIVKIP